MENPRVKRFVPRAPYIAKERRVAACGKPCSAHQSVETQAPGSSASGDPGATCKVSASRQNQALSALLFLSRHVLNTPLRLEDLVRARKPKRLPVVMTRPEVKAVLSHLEGKGVAGRDAHVRNRDAVDGMFPLAGERN